MPSSIAVENRRDFERVFGHPPQFAARAPGRVNLIGEHVDYQDGLVLPAAIDRHIYASAAPIAEREVRLWSSVSDRPPVVVPLENDEPLKGEDAWANYAFGVIAQYRDRGFEDGGIEIAFRADLPLGAGVSSSAALESATALVVEAAAGIELDPGFRAVICQEAEHQFAGVPCGPMDQLAVNCGVAGHVLRIDCLTCDPEPVMLHEGISMVVVDSKVKHALAEGEYAARKADCQAACDVDELGVFSLREATLASIEILRGLEGDDRIYRRARHVVTEIERVREFLAAIEAGEMSKLAPIMAASHASLRDDFEVSCEELDELVAIAVELGTLGSRMMGGGFGGSTINLFPSETAESKAAEIVDFCAERHGRDVEAFVANPADAAQIIPV